MKPTKLSIILSGLLVILGLSASCSQQPAEEAVMEEPTAVEQTLDNTLTQEEIAEGWELLFDGESLDKWRAFRGDEVPPGWKIQDGTLFFDGKDAGEGYGDLMTREQFADFELKLEWKISPGGNSGILYRVSEDQEQEFHTGPEMQILDDKDERYAELDRTHYSGANYALDPPAVDNVKPVGEWNSVHLVVNGAHVEHWQNGDKVVEYELWTPEWKEAVSKTKFAEWPGYGMNKKGHIVLQDHGSGVWFKNIKIKRLNQEEPAETATE